MPKKVDPKGDKPVSPDPEELLRAILHISSGDAAEVRENADTKAQPDIPDRRPKSKKLE